MVQLLIYSDDSIPPQFCISVMHRVRYTAYIHNKTLRMWIILNLATSDKETNSQSSCIPGERKKEIYNHLLLSQVLKYIISNEKKNLLHPNKKERDKEERCMNEQLVDGGRLHKSYSMVAVQCWVAIKYTVLQITEGNSWHVQPFDFRCPEKRTKQPLGQSGSPMGCKFSWNLPLSSVVLLFLLISFKLRK